MRQPNNPPDQAFLQTIGRRLAAWRLVRNLTQADVAEEAGLGMRTIQRLESGDAATHLSGFFRVCSVLGLLDRIDAAIPEPPPSPMVQLKSQRKERKRATRVRRTGPARKKWTWDENA